MVDQKDAKILECLAENGRHSTQEIAKNTHIPITTVHNRMKRLVRDGVIKGYTVVVDYKKTGKPIAAYVLVNVDYALLKQSNSSQHDLILKIKQRAPVEDVAMVTGSKDIVLKIRVATIDKLNGFVTQELRTIAGVGATETLVVLEEF